MWDLIVSVPDHCLSFYFTKADWPSLKALCETEINNTILQADDPIDRFTTTLPQIAIKTIPRTSIKSKKKKKPWFNDDCKTSIQKRKQALRQFNVHPLHQNLKISCFSSESPPYDSRIKTEILETICFQIEFSYIN